MHDEPARTLLYVLFYAYFLKFGFEVLEFFANDEWSYFDFPWLDSLVKFLNSIVWLGTNNQPNLKRSVTFIVQGRKSALTLIFISINLILEFAWCVKWKSASIA